MRAGLVAAVASAALLVVAPALGNEADAAAQHPIAGEYVGHSNTGATVHFKYENHRIDDLVIGPRHDPDVFAGGIDVVHGQFQHGNLSKSLYGHWCDHNHMIGHYETNHSSLTFHAHRLHHGVEGHRCG